MKADVVLGLVGSFFTLALLFEMLRRKKLREKYAVFWALVAVATLVVATFPSTLVHVSALVGVAVPANLLFFLASMLLLAVSVQHSAELSRIEERTRVLAEEVALLRLELESERSTARREPLEDAWSMREPR